jgi:SPP1 family predicted phage head-tail adaptor
MYRAGELDQLITIKRETRTDDGMGGATSSLTIVASDLWAHARPRRGKELGEFQGVRAQALYLFVIRNDTDLALEEDDRIEWNGETYNIRAILSEGARSMYLEIEAERGVEQ